MKVCRRNVITYMMYEAVAAGEVSSTVGVVGKWVRSSLRSDHRQSGRVGAYIIKRKLAAPSPIKVCRVLYILRTALLSSQLKVTVLLKWETASSSPHVLCNEHISRLYVSNKHLSSLNPLFDSSLRCLVFS